MKKTEKKIKELLNRGIIRTSTSTWRTPIRVVEKPDKTIRICQNLIPLNNITSKDGQEIPRMKDIINRTKGSNYFTVVDLKEAFYSVELEESDKFKTAFEFDGLVYEWNSMPMGFKNSPMVMQRIMNNILKNLIHKGVEVYLDDIIIYSKNEKEHQGIIKNVFKILKENKLTINQSKIQWMKNEVIILGVTINGKEKTPNEIKTKEIVEYARSITIRNLRGFIGLVNWYRDYIPECSDKIRNLTDAIKKGKKLITWNSEMEKKFKDIKTEITSLKPLGIPDYNEKFVLRTDASNTGVGAVLTQKQNGKSIPIQWASKKLTSRESRWGITEKEMFAVKWEYKNLVTN